MGLIAVSGAIKALDTWMFARAIHSWSLIPVAVIPAIAVAIPAIELGLGTSWFLGLARSRVLRLTIILLVLFTTTFVIHIMVAGAPECGCFGAVQVFESHRAESQFTLARNTMLLAVFGVANRILVAHRRIT
jgi:hypothetical protein